MRRVTNVILKHDNQLLLLKKPKRGWYAMPGGKLEHGELIKEAAEREFWEETGLRLLQPELRGVFTFLVKNHNQVVEEWMMFTFFCDSFQGSLKEECEEGELEWVPVEVAADKPMAEGDSSVIRHILNRSDILYGTFTYTQDYQLVDQKFDTEG